MICISYNISSFYSWVLEKIGTIIQGVPKKERHFKHTYKI